MKLDLVAWIERTSQEPFQYGVNDCALWAASWWQEVTGHDPARALRGTYTSYREHLRIVRRHGGVEAVCRACMAGIPEGAGDGIGVLKSGPQDLAAILAGGVAIYRTEGGVMYDYAPHIVVSWAY